MILHDYRVCADGTASHLIVTLSELLNDSGISHNHEQVRVDGTTSHRNKTLSERLKGSDFLLSPEYLRTSH